MDTLINRRSHGHTEKQNFSLSVEKNSNKWNIFIYHEKRNFVSSRSRAMFYYYWCKSANEIPRHLTYIFFFAANSVIYHVAIAMMVISNVKITCYFHVRRYHVFTRKLTWYFIGGCITRQNLCRRLQFEEQEQLWITLLALTWKPLFSS